MMFPLSVSAMHRLVPTASRSSSSRLIASSRSSVSTLAINPIANSRIATPLRKHNQRRQHPRQYSHRRFSSFDVPRRGYPQYTIFSHASALSLRPQLPSFKRAGQDGISVERRGKLVLDFVPRNKAGTGYAWDNKTPFSLSVEEMGLVLSQLPSAGVELSHKLYYGNSNNSGSDGSDGEGSNVKVLSGDLTEKVLTVEPREGATVSFKVDFVKDGIGGQVPEGITFPGTPIEVTLQAGEFEVVKSILQTSIPYLLGWNATMDLAAAAAISKGVSGGGQFY